MAFGCRVGAQLSECRGPDCRDRIRMSIYDKYSGSMKFTTHLDQISHCKKASGTDWSNRWTYRIFIIHTRRDKIGLVFRRFRVSEPLRG